MKRLQISDAGNGSKVDNNLDNSARENNKKQRGASVTALGASGRKMMFASDMLREINERTSDLLARLQVFEEGIVLHLRTQASITPLPAEAIAPPTTTTTTTSERATTATTTDATTEQLIANLLTLTKRAESVRSLLSSSTITTTSPTTVSHLPHSVLETIMNMVCGEEWNHKQSYLLSQVCLQWWLLIKKMKKSKKSIAVSGVQLAHMAFSELLQNFPSASSLTFAHTRSRPLQATNLSPPITQLSHVTSLTVEFHSIATNSICKILHHMPNLQSFTTSWTSKRAMQVFEILAEMKFLTRLIIRMPPDLSDSNVHILTKCFAKLEYLGMADPVGAGTRAPMKHQSYEALGMSLRKLRSFRLEGVFTGLTIGHAALFSPHLEEFELFQELEPVPEDVLANFFANHAATLRTVKLGGHWAGSDNFLGTRVWSALAPCHALDIECTRFQIALLHCINISRFCKELRTFSLRVFTKGGKQGETNIFFCVNDRNSIQLDPRTKRLYQKLCKVAARHSHT